MVDHVTVQPADPDRPVLVFGTGTLGRLACYFMEHDSPRNVEAFVADREYIDDGTCMDRPVLPFDEIVDTHPPGDYDLQVVLSYAELNENRIKKYRQAKDKGYRLVTYICSETVRWGETEVGDNCTIWENNTIQPGARIGDNVFMSTANHIAHHADVGDHCFFSSHVVLSGYAEVGPRCFLGVNATIRDGVTLAEGTVVGANATVTKDTEPYGVYMGTPAERTDEDGRDVDYFTDTGYGDDG